jgi:hypothetical protein
MYSNTISSFLTNPIPNLDEYAKSIAVVDSRMHPPEELYAILGLFEGEVDIRERETEKGSARFLKIKRMSNQEYLDDEQLLKKGELQRKG